MVELMVAEDIEIVAENAVQHCVSLAAEEIEVRGVAGNLVSGRDHEKVRVCLTPRLYDAHERLRPSGRRTKSAEGDPYRVNIGVDVIHVEDLQGVRRIRGRYP